MWTRTLHVSVGSRKLLSLFRVLTNRADSPLSVSVCGPSIGGVSRSLSLSMALQPTDYVESMAESVPERNGSDWPFDPARTKGELDLRRCGIHDSTTRVFSPSPPVQDGES